MTRLTIPVHLRWSDIDAYQHVNNAKIFTILEETRIAAFWDGPAAGGAGRKVFTTGPGSGTNTYIARQEIEYLEPLPYTPGPLAVQLWICHLGGASLDVCYEIDGADGPAVRAMSTMVLVDEVTGRPRRLTAGERAACQPFLDEPVRFRRRRG
ncbi:acyl-CoA thioesterase [Georgenia ruanii]|uniref:Acyl-CoA thioesterase n=1 Tax=Georgenia ruanii TaxID=348442 RepID=A0A7J9UU01_9MICO|nr:thioesterase family protein [Georgenia ruanii]MPV87234.1 acyl-CoA thioesterase [Georgenia ruanii]